MKINITTTIEINKEQVIPAIAEYIQKGDINSALNNLETIVHIEEGEFDEILSILYDIWNIEPMKVAEQRGIFDKVQASLITEYTHYVFDRFDIPYRNTEVALRLHKLLEIFRTATLNQNQRRNIINFQAGLTAFAQRFASLVSVMRIVTSV